MASGRVYRQCAVYQQLADQRRAARGARAVGCTAERVHLVIVGGPAGKCLITELW
jgi:hypothetical protein